MIVPSPSLLVRTSPVGWFGLMGYYTLLSLLVLTEIAPTVCVLLDTPRGRPVEPMYDNLTKRKRLRRVPQGSRLTGEPIETAGPGSLSEGRKPMLETSYERDGFDGTRGATEWWFEAWGVGSKDEWTIRRDAGRPPTPDELVRADYIVFGFRRGRHVFYKTWTGGIDLDVFNR